jgi:hypothetical protein
MAVGVRDTEPLWLPAGTMQAPMVPSPFAFGSMIEKATVLVGFHVSAAQ